MSRLIDADEVKRFYNEEFPTLDNGVHWSRNDIIMNLSNIPTVKAISIEWLHSIMEKQLIFAMKSEMEGTTTVQDGVIHCISGALACQVVENVIELWEKENDLL